MAEMTAITYEEEPLFKVLTKSLLQTLLVDAFEFFNARFHCRRHVLAETTIRYEPNRLKAPVWGPNLFPEDLVNSVLSEAARVNQSPKVRWGLVPKRKFEPAGASARGRRETLHLSRPLEVQQLGFQHNFQRSGVELDKRVPSTDQFLSTSNGGTKIIYRRPIAEERNPKSPSLKISRSLVQRAKERLRQAKSNPRPVPSELLHSLRQVPHANRLSGADLTSPRGRHHFYRSYRCLLSRFNSKALSSFPWLQTRQTSLCIQSDAIRAQHSLGFQVNLDKSRLVPETKFQWLGLQWDLRSHTLCLPKAKRTEIEKNTKRFLRDKLTSSRNQERILGSLQFASITDIVLKAKLKDINRVWRSRANKKRRDKRARLPLILRKSLQPWTKVKSLSKSVPLQYPAPGLVIHTDASLTGWGGYSQHKKVQGLWSTIFRQFHINVLEAMAVFLTLKQLNPARNLHIRLVLDSAVIVHCLNRGGSKSAHINDVMLAIFSMATSNKWHLSAVHLAGVRNVVADALSRTTPLESEWSLDKQSFKWILSQVPGLQVDLFATESNHKLECYVAPNLDPRAYATDAMFLDWNVWKRIYLFHPINLLKVLDKLRSFRGRVALVAPNWPKSSWFPLLLELGLCPQQIPNPILTQVVQTRNVLASSRIQSALTLWTS
ncbi:uncharacterized protein [Palaemon carinicauda]|uniref:uncharacterized protein n=1 Tax=Palaemon carinicauda TaxID=392227 RepID=UPI0035B643D5